MDFSIVLPSLCNTDNLKKMFESFERTTKKKDRIEFLIAIDEGSGEKFDQCDPYSYSFCVKVFERRKTRDFTNDYYNWLANRAFGKNIMAFNDDAWMRTYHWDVKLLNRIKEIGRSLYLLDIPDTARIKYRNQFPCFPMISRRALCTLGFLLCPEVKMYPADKVTYEIYAQSNLAFPVRDVLIEHEHILESDESKSHMMEAYIEDGGVNKQIDISEYIHKLLLSGSAEANKRQSKLKRIINILKES